MEIANPSFATDIQPIFTRRCAIGGCHSLNSARAEMVLVAGHAYDSIVNKPSFLNPALDRVEPGDAANSWLVRMIEDDENRAPAVLRADAARRSAVDAQPDRDDRELGGEWCVAELSSAYPWQTSVDIEGFCGHFRPCAVPPFSARVDAGGGAPRMWRRAVGRHDGASELGGRRFSGSADASGGCARTSPNNGRSVKSRGDSPMAGSWSPIPVARACGIPSSPWKATT